ncbi:MAG TPA: alkene reductase [Kiritimatiellia bacterium]|nr:alkene reductase [Kiritimatiellia bacterium]HMO98351.1 alkene reductase [Kiritimatiellia bacterium]
MTDQVSLFSAFTLGDITLANRVVMAPMTRCRATADHTPTPLMATYYAQRATAGLIVTEGTSPSSDGLGYARIPGIFNEAQVTAWRAVTDAVHARGGRIFVQMMHTGRVSHPLNMPEGTRVLAPSAIGMSGTMWTDQQGMQPYPVPVEMTDTDIEQAIETFVAGAEAAMKAGFDGVELHGANGYLIDQFLNTASNRRTDRWGGSVENRLRFAVEVAKRVAEKIGAGRVGMRISPFGVFNDMKPDEEMGALYALLAAHLSEIGLAYIHVVDHSAMGAPAVPDSVKATIRANFKGTYILSGGYDSVARAEEDLAARKGDLVAFGRPFIANPDLVARLRDGKALAAPNPDTFYTPGEAGYSDYPALG